ncbi:MAG TPA: peptidoglycan editing factor PgeF [Mycobacteriales bacterium]|nr:peptidoglycan editing factor PgeF [Mycobacteriales bacterium]
MAGLDLLDAGLPGVVGGFTTRGGGVSAPPWESLNLASHVGDELGRVLANADLLARHLGAEGINLPHQMHGAEVLIVDSSTSGLRTHSKLGGVDALVTARPGIAIGVLVADCTPVLIADPVAGIVAAAHAGRRGLGAGVLQATLTEMVDIGAEVGRMRAVVGPAICGRCYEVPESMRSEVDALVPGTATVTRAGTPGLDLPAGAMAVLRAAGVAEVRSIGICTAEDERFYSYRRDGVTGRFAGVVMLATDD